PPRPEVGAARRRQRGGVAASQEQDLVAHRPRQRTPHGPHASHRHGLDLPRQVPHRRRGTESLRRRQRENDSQAAGEVSAGSYNHACAGAAEKTAAGGSEWTGIINARTKSDVSRSHGPRGARGAILSIFSRKLGMSKRLWITVSVLLFVV